MRVVRLERIHYPKAFLDVLAGFSGAADHKIGEDHDARFSGELENLPCLLDGYPLVENLQYLVCAGLDSVMNATAASFSEGFNHVGCYGIHSRADVPADIELASDNLPAYFDDPLFADGERVVVHEELVDAYFNALFHLINDALGAASAKLVSEMRTIIWMKFIVSWNGWIFDLPFRRLYAMGMNLTR